MPETVSLANLPVEGGRVPGFWRVAFRDALDDTFAGCVFRAGISQEPIDGQKVRHLVAAMGGSIRALERLDGECVLGDASAFPVALPKIEAPREPVAVQKARTAPASANTNDVSDDDLTLDFEPENDIAAESTAVTRAKAASTTKRKR